ncbi:hypothetical protein ACHAWO_009699 [Cyclotella atomus]|uniref:Uncharacterized protein n=1 Tax=Cyclotella atomus TaxID=382360 RepID=A0ABD3NSK8_9STRA
MSCSIACLDNLFIGATGPQEGSTSFTGDGFKYHTVGGGIDSSMVFEVETKGKTMILKNIKSTVHLKGWSGKTPEIYEAESATIYNVTVVPASSANGGNFVNYGNDQSYVEWDLSVATAGQYYISFRYALDAEPHPLSLFYTEAIQQLKRERCIGDCDNDDHCAGGLICYQNNGLIGQEVPSCMGFDTGSTNYCVDPNDYTHGILFKRTGGWNDDWLQTEKIEVALLSGTNTTRLQIPSGYDAGPNIDFMKVEGVTSATLPSPPSFRNPLHFMSHIADYSPYGIGKQTVRDAQYITVAVLDHYFYNDNVAPFICIRLMQSFGFSNPSPRYVSQCTNAFRSGYYESRSISGCLESTLASIILDLEATSASLSLEPNHGALREPILQVLNLLCSMEYQTQIPDLDG